MWFRYYIPLFILSCANNIVVKLPVPKLTDRYGDIVRNWYDSVKIIRVISPLGKVLSLKNSRLNSNLAERGLNHPLETFWGLGQNVLKEAYVNLGFFAYGKRRRRIAFWKRRETYRLLKVREKCVFGKRWKKCGLWKERGKVWSLDSNLDIGNGRGHFSPTFRLFTRSFGCFWAFVRVNLLPLCLEY